MHVLGWGWDRSCVAIITRQALVPLLIPTLTTGSDATGEKGQLSYPRQGHFQGLHKVWEGERDPDPPNRACGQ